MSTTLQRITLRAFAPDRHLPLVCDWLRLPHVTRWWGDAAVTQAAVREHPVAESALICLNDVPVGYLCWQIPTRQELQIAGLSDLPDNLVDIDIFIGEVAATGRSVGSVALSQLCDRLRRQGVRLVGMATAADNHAARRAYEKVGFCLYRHFREGGDDMNYFTKALDADAQPVVAPDVRQPLAVASE